MGSNADENRKYPWDAVIRELIAKGEVSENVLHDSDTIIRWWRSLDPAKQEEIKSRVEELSQGVAAEVPEKKMTPKEELDNSSVYTLIEEEPDNKVSEEASGKRPATPSAHRSRKTPIILLSLALLASIVYCFVITEERNALNEEVETVNNTLSSTRTQLLQTVGDLRDTKQSLTSTQSELTSTKQSLTSVQSELSSTKGALNSVQTDLSSIKEALNSVQSDLETAEEKLKLYKETFGADVSSNMQPPIKKPSSDYVKLNDNSTAINPTWQELEAFLLSDPTDINIYQENRFNCTNFAEMLHNNAEDAGIKAAFVAITFEDEPIGHTLNAFKTTDKGLVYVDCTNEDNLAYVEIDKEYGLIQLAEAGSLSYSFYEEYKQKWQEYEKLLRDYNLEVMQFNLEVDEYEWLLENYNGMVARYNRGYSAYCQSGPPFGVGTIAEMLEKLFFHPVDPFQTFEEMRNYLEQQDSTLKEQRTKLEDWKIRLEEKDEVINELGEELGGSWFEPLGIVEDIHIYW